MTRSDQQLLDRQLRSLNLPQRPDGTIMLAIAAVFVTGLVLGNLHPLHPAPTGSFASILAAGSADAPQIAQ